VEIGVDEADLEAAEAVTAEDEGGLVLAVAEVSLHFFELDFRPCSTPWLRWAVLCLLYAFSAYCKDKSS
jgi:hypothetical protein